MRRRNKGFTLIEVMVAVVIFTIITVTVYGVFYMGIRTWQRSQQEESLQKIRSGFLKMEKELKKGLFFPEAPFKGTLSYMEFPLFIPDDEKENIRLISYSIENDDESGLKRIIRRDGEVLRGMMPLMKEARFEYAYKSNDPSEDLEWQGAWDGDALKGLPPAVRVSLKRDDDGEFYSKVIFLQGKGVE